jgi:AbrB family looped-hinge helix DNA binding protein
MKTTLVSQKGQILIPVSIRKKYGLKTGSKVVVSDDGEGIRLTPLTSATIRSYAGILKGKVDLTASLLSSRKEDRKKGK